jgi:hypothetical protein
MFIIIVTFYFVKRILYYTSWGIAHNVPAVYDVLPARIRALRSIASAGSATRACIRSYGTACARMRRGNGAAMT